MRLHTTAMLYVGLLLIGMLLVLALLLLPDNRDAEADAEAGARLGETHRIIL